MSWLNDEEEFDENYPEPGINPGDLPGGQTQPGGPGPGFIDPGVGPGGVPNSLFDPGAPGNTLGGGPPLAPWLDPGIGPGGVPNSLYNPGAPGNTLGGGPPTAPNNRPNLLMRILQGLGGTSGAGNNASNAIAGGLGALNQSVQAGANRQATADLQTQRVALEQSQQNPYKSLLYQTQSANKADRLANADFSAKPVKVAGRYGDAAGPTTPGANYNPSASTRGNARAVLAMILAGKKTPTMTDPKNYGKEPAVENAPDYTPPWLADQLRSQGH